MAAPRLTDTRWGTVAMAVQLILTGNVSVGEWLDLLAVCARATLTEQPGQQSDS